MINAGTIEYIAKIDTGQFKKNARQLENSAEKSGQKIERSFKSKIKALGPAFKKMAIVGTAAFAGVSVGIGKAIQEAGDAEKIAENFENTFGESSKTIGKFINEFGDDFAFVESELMNGANSIGFQLNALGDLTKDEADNMTESLLTAAGGLSDFFGETLNVEEASKKLASGLSGNTQALLDMGYNVRTEDVENMAEAMGMNTDELSRSDRAMALTQLIMDQTEGSIEGLSDGMDTYTGRQRAARKAGKETAQSLGRVFLPMSTKVLKSLTPLIENIADFFEENGDKIAETAEKVLAWFVDLGRGALDLGRKVWDYLGPKLGDLWQTINGKLIPALKEFWKDVIEPLLPVIGVTLVAAVGFAIDAFDLFLEAITPAITWLSDNEWIVWSFIGAVGAFKTAMIISGVVAKFQAGMTAVKVAYATTAAVITAPLAVVIATGAAMAALWKLMNRIREYRDASREAGLAANTQADNAELQRQRLTRIVNSNIHSNEARENARNTLIRLFGSGNVGENYKGTDNWRGGLTWVGERGPELVNLPKGSSVTPNNEIDDMSGSTVNNYINNIEIANEVDGENWLRKLGREEEITEKGLTRG